MAKIREDLVGVVRLDDGRVLSPGDTIPDGLEVGDHLIGDQAPAVKPPAPSNRSRKGDGGSGSSK